MLKDKSVIIFILRNSIYNLILLVIIISQIKYASGPVIMPDEVGYWAAGATFAGLNWSGVMYMSPYYGYGYGFILSILFNIFDDSVKMFQGAIVINAFLLVIAYWLSYCIIKTLALDLSDRLKSLLSFSVTVYSFNIYYSQNTEAEIIQIVLYLLLCLLVLQISTHKKKFEWRMIILSLTSVYMLACHLRNVCVVLVLCITVFALCFTKKISIKSFVCYMVSMFVCIVIFLKIRIYVNTNLYVVTNYTSEEVIKVQGALGIFSIEGLKSFLVNVCGRLFYIGCATFLIGYRGIEFILCGFVRTVVERIRKNKSDFDGQYIFQFFVLATLMSEIAIGSLSFLGNQNRIDGFLYGRYSEHVLIPILIYGVINIHKSFKFVKGQLICIVVLLLQAIFMHHIYVINKTIESGTHSIAGILGFGLCNDLNEDSIQFIYSFGIAIVGVLVACIMCYMLQNKKVYMKFAGLCFAAFCWIICSVSALHNYFFEFLDYNRELYSFAKEVSSQTVSPIYYVTDKGSEALIRTSSTWLMYRIQYFLANSDIMVIDINELSDQDLIMAYKYSTENEKIISTSEYNIVIEGERLVLYQLNKK